jgi:hypothetical protein
MSVPSRNLRSTDGVHRGEMFEDDPQLAAFARDLRAAVDAEPIPAISPALAAVLEGLEPAPQPAWVPPASRQHRPLRIRLAIGAGVFSLGVGGLGVAGALPAPVQRQVANFGDSVGVDLPEPASDTPAANVVPTSLPARGDHRGAGTTRTSAEDHRGGPQGDDVEPDDETTATTDTDQGDEHSAPQAGDDVGRSGDHPTPTTTVPAGADDEHPTPDEHAPKDDGAPAQRQDPTLTPRELGRTLQRD